MFDVVCICGLCCLLSGLLILYRFVRVLVVFNLFWAVVLRLVWFNCLVDLIYSSCFSGLVLISCFLFGVDCRICLGCGYGGLFAI